MDVSTIVQVVRICDQKTVFGFKNFYFNEKENWNCEYTKSSAKMLHIEDIKVSNTNPSEVYDLDKNCKFFIIIFI